MAGKKKGKKSGKKAEKGASKKEPQMTIREAILAYQIGIKENQLGELLFEQNGLEEKNKRNTERSGRLKEDQSHHIRALLKQARERDKELEEITVVNRDHVEEALREKWKYCKEQEQLVEDLQKEIEEVEKKCNERQADVRKWLEYRKSGQREHAIQIKLLQDDLQDSQESFNEMKGHLQKTLSIAKEEIEKSTEERLRDQKHVASEKAMTTLDNWTTQEVKDNDWLRTETELHRKEVNHLRDDVETLERENLEIMSRLFECRVDDLKISRQFFLTQFQDNENLDETGILEVDLAQLALKDGKSSRRPGSATSRAVEDKVFSLPVLREREGSSEEVDSESDDPLDNYLNYEDEGLNEYLQLGPVELKALQVVGEAKPLHPPVKLTDEEEQAKLAAPDSWPVTPDMLRTVAQ